MIRKLIAACVTAGVVGLGGCSGSSLDGPESYARETDEGLKVTLGPAFFDYDQTELGVLGQEEVWRIARLLHQKPASFVIIEGHTDDVGPDDYNVALSMERARAVKRALIDHGIGAERMTIAARGEALPATFNTTEYGRSRNRRVEVIIE